MTYSFSNKLFQLFVVLGAVLTVIFYRVSVVAFFYKLTADAEIAGQKGSNLGSLAVTITATTMSLIFIIILNVVSLQLFT